MKRLIIFLLCSCTALLPALAQQNTELGYIIPTSDTIRVLMVFAEVEYDTTPGACTKSPPPCPGYNAWGTDSTGRTAVPDGADTIFDYSSSVGGFPSGYITDYYHQASLGNYVVLGDYLPFVVTVSCSSMTASSLNVTPVVNVINNDTSLPATLLSANGLELEDFDLFDWNPGPSNYGKSKPKGKDGQIDMMFIVWRNNQYLDSEIQSNCLGCQSGYGLTTVYSPTLKGYGSVVTASSYNGCLGADATIPITLAEYLHGLFGGNNWHTAGGRGNYTFLDAPHSYSITGQSGSVGKLANGWDRFTMGWYHPDNTLDTIAALDNANDPVVSDITIAHNPDSMIFILRDFVQTGDVARIKLPHINWQQTGDVKNQYLWLENRQLQTRFDKWYNSECSDNNNGGFPIGVPGLYAYVQVGKDVKRGNGIYSPSDDHPNAMGSWFMPLTGEGNYDYTFRTDKEQSAIPYGQPGHPCNWDNDNVPVDTDDREPNPLTGFSDLFKLLDYNENGTLKSGDDIKIYLSEYFPAEDTVIHNAHGFGDWQDAYYLGGNHKLALYTNPAPLPVYTYRSNGYPNVVNGVPQIDPWENRTIYLNGLSIEILDTIHNATTGGHDIKIKVKWDDYDVLEDVRWTGNIVLQNDTLDPYGRQSQVVLAAGKKIYLDRGLSPTQHVVNDTFNGQPLFTKPTVFTARDSTLIHLKEGSTLYIRDDSRLVVEPDARIVAEDSACIVVEDQGVLELRHNNNLTLSGTGATVIIKSGGTIRTADSVDLTFSGSGYLQFHAGALAALGNNSRLLLAGSGIADTLLWLHPNAVLDIDSHAIDIRQGTIVQQSGAQLVHQQAPSYLLNVDFRGNNGLGYKAVAAPQVELYHTRFYDHTDGVIITDIDSAKGNFITISDGTFSNINNNAITLERIQRRVQVSNTTISNSDGLYGIKADSVAQLALHHSTIGTMTTGIHHTGGGDVLLYNTTLEDNYTGIYAPSGHVFLRDNSYIRDNTFGIDMPNGTSDSSLLVVGDIGCGHVIGHSHTAIKGTNIVLHIDALQHAAVRCQDTSDVAPNRFDGNTKLFDICYQAFSVDTVYAMGNYWDNGQAPAAGKININNFIFGPGCKEPVVLRSGLHATTLPTGCLGNSGELGNCDSVTPPYSSVFFSDRLALNDTVYIATYMGKGYYAFVDSNLALADQELTAITGEPIDSDTTYTGGSKHLVRLARMLVPTVDRHAAYDVAPASESGKKGISDEETISDERIQVFPNPVQQTLYVQGIPKASWLTLTDVQGRIAKRQFLPAGDATVEVQSLAQGFYVLTLQDATGNIYHRDKVMVGR